MVLILDTGVVIELGTWPDTDELALPAIAVVEYLAGVRQDPDRPRSGRCWTGRGRSCGLGYDEETAEHHAELLAHTRRAGMKRGPHERSSPPPPGQGVVCWSRPGPVRRAARDRGPPRAQPDPSQLIHFAMFGGS
jgi:hypothetical protein